jgi:PKHD-type hydroxylase
MSFWGLKDTLATTDHVSNWAFAVGVFSKEECQKIIELGETLYPSRAVTIGENLDSAPSIRKSNVSWLVPSEKTEWLYRKLTDFVNTSNDQFFHFDLWGFSEGLQFTKYEAPDGKYDQHIDKIFSKNVRKLSVVVQLTDPAEYEGGDLNLYDGRLPTVAPRGLGNVGVFPSYVLHQVTPVTKGVRYSLVAWITGPQFK